MTPTDIVKQLTTYADGITAFCVIQALGFVYAVAGNEPFSKRVVRDDGAFACTIGIVLGTALYCFLVFKCAALIDKQKVETKPPKGIQTARYCFIVGAGVLAGAALWLIKFNPVNSQH